MRNASKIITGLALAGLAVAGGAAFTAPGLANNVTTQSAFVGGQVSTDVSGAVLEDIDFTQAPVLNGLTKVTAVTLTFDGATPVGSLASIQFNNHDGGLLDPTVKWTSDVAVSPVDGSQIAVFTPTASAEQTVFADMALVVTVTPPGAEETPATGIPSSYGSSLTTAAPTALATP